MSEKQTKQSPKPASASTNDAGAAQIKQKFDQANEQGYWGEVPDETPNSAYTVKGVIAAAKQAERKRE